MFDGDLSAYQNRIVNRVKRNKYIAGMQKKGFVGVFFVGHADGVVVTVSATIDGEQHVSRMLMRFSMDKDDIEDACGILLSAISRSAALVERHRENGA